MNTDVELIYQQSVARETKTIMENYQLIVGRSTDKQFATGFVGGLYKLQYGINYSGKLGKNVSKGFEAGYRLGLSIEQIIHEIKPGIESFRKEVTEYRKKQKRRITGIRLHWKKNRMGLPIGLEHVELKMTNPDDPYGVVGPFGDAFTDADIAYELGKMKALEQFIEFATEQYILLGGIVEDFGKRSTQLNTKYQQLCIALYKDDLDTFISVLKTLFATLPYQLDKYESTYHNIIHTLLDVLGFHILSELPTNTGRIDAVIETPQTIFIMEFKVDSESGLEQIEKKGYHERFLHHGKKIMLVGINISSFKKTIAHCEHKIIFSKAVMA